VATVANFGKSEVLREQGKTRVLIPNEDLIRNRSYGVSIKQQQMLSDIAHKQGISESAVVRFLLEEYLKANAIGYR
jgi:hypothetical protein